MAKDLKVHGPIDICCPKNGATKFIDKKEKKQFLAKLDRAGLTNKQGCYVFAIRAGKGYCPWYVGKATKGMKQECMGLHQLQQYNAVLSKCLRGTPVMFFLTPDGKGNKVPKTICNNMETFLIQSALNENPDLRNIQKTKIPEWSIDGVVRSKKGKPTGTEVAFRKAMGL